jgi:hypothetical protein
MIKKDYSSLYYDKKKKKPRKNIEWDILTYTITVFLFRCLNKSIDIFN